MRDFRFCFEIGDGFLVRRRQLHGALVLRRHTGRIASASLSRRLGCWGSRSAEGPCRALNSDTPIAGPRAPRGAPQRLLQERGEGVMERAAWFEILAPFSGQGPSCSRPPRSAARSGGDRRWDPGPRIDQLRRDPHFVSRSRHRTFHDCIHVQLLGNVRGRRSILALELHRRSAGDDAKLADGRQVRCQFIGHPFSEVVLVGIARVVVQWKHGNRSNDSCGVRRGRSRAQESGRHDQVEEPQTERRRAPCQPLPHGGCTVRGGAPSESERQSSQRLRGVMKFANTNSATERPTC